MLWVLITVSTVASFVLALTTVSKVIRLRNVRMSWKAGKIKGYPLFSGIFSGFALLFSGIAFLQGDLWVLFASLFYVGIGSAWFLTSMMTSKRFITDHGIVKNVNEPSQTVAWHQIRDFVERKTKWGINYMFIYCEDGSRNEGGSRNEDSVIRLELDVPAKKVPEFQKLISHKLGRRISCCTEDTVTVEQFE